MNIGDDIVRIATEFEGLVEVKSNKAWRDSKRGKVFEEMIKRAGHEDGWPYCMTFCEGVWRIAYEEANRDFSVIARLLNPSVMASYEAIRNAGIETHIQMPLPGAIFLMQSGHTTRGHAGIVTGCDGRFLSTIEANTSPSAADVAADRDGGLGTGGVWRKRRAFDYSRKPGLWLRGILNPL